MSMTDYLYDESYLTDNEWHEKLHNIPEITEKILMQLQDKKGMEKRIGQVSMSYEIAQSIYARENIMVEAGVGIGKSFAYLIPALLVQRRLSRPIVLVTASIALSDQLMKDVGYTCKIISEYVHEPFEIIPTLAKGARNYICPKKIADLMEKKKIIKGKECNKKKLTWQDKKIKNYPDWILNIKNAIERDDFKKKITPSQWQQICGDSCANEKRQCIYKDKCYYNKMRKNINNGGKAKIIIINMDMFIVHLKLLRQKGRGLLNENAILYIIDEAHNLEEKTRLKLTISKNKDNLLSLMDKIQTALQKKQHGILQGKTEKNITIMKNSINKIFTNEVKYITKYRKEDEQHEDATKFYYFKGKNTDKNGIDGWLKFLRNVHKEIDVSDLPIDKDGKIIADLEDFIELINAFLPESDNILWFQEDEDTDNKLAICSAPKNIDNYLKEMLFNDNLTPKILTSATLCQNNLSNEHAYDYQRSTIGYEGNLGESKKSPFNYDDNSIMYIPNDIVSPTDDHEKYLDEISKRIKELADITTGRTLCLFTSKKDMNCVYENLNELHLKWKILIQSSETSQKEIIRMYKKDKGILLSTGLWEGFNIKGPDISSVIIVRLPFPVPDPIIDYKVSTYSNNRNEVTIPEMLRKLRQGIGRLIRSNEDTGILSILDSRMKKYQESVLEVSPIKQVVRNLNDVKSFSKRKFVLK
ncbi:ATP-dependent DNA helicase [Pectinatus sottacetonis]|uniref:ATP-dependent DNA helicase n=1 Tax=Pectinatus sottacetonis TaxID=1002795 RepID=UPI0018C55646|nr:ATP-dependent DNA helicase [Pectinatus sottacetonis]